MNTKLLKRRLEDENKSLNDLADCLGINVATLYRKLNGTSDFTRYEIQQIRLYVPLSKEDIYSIFFAGQLA